MLTDRELMTVIQDFRRSDWIAVRLVHDELEIQLTKRVAGQPLPSGWDQGGGEVAASAATQKHDEVTPAPDSPASASRAPEVGSANAQTSPVFADTVADPEGPVGVPAEPDDLPVGTDGAAAGTDGTAGSVIAAGTLGNFWVAPAPGSDPFVQPGDSVEVGQQVAIVEVMKLMTEVLAVEAGTVAEVLAEDGELVQAGQPLFRIVPNGAPA